MKEIQWIGSAYEDLLHFPKEAKREAGYQLDKVQHGEEPSDWKPMPSIGMGVKEIRIHANNEYRIIYLAKYTDNVYVLHCFAKKTHKTTQKDIKLAKTRCKQLKRNER